VRMSAHHVPVTGPSERSQPRSGGLRSSAGSIRTISARADWARRSPSRDAGAARPSRARRLMQWCPACAVAPRAARPRRPECRGTVRAPSLRRCSSRHAGRAIVKSCGLKEIRRRPSSACAMGLWFQSISATKALVDGTAILSTRLSRSPRYRFSRSPLPPQGNFLPSNGARVRETEPPQREREQTSNDCRRRKRRCASCCARGGRCHRRPRGLASPHAARARRGRAPD
jgi:hypothetical protein